MKQFRVTFVFDAALGHRPFFGAMQIDGFIDKGEFKKQIDEWIRLFRKIKPAPGTNGPLNPATRSAKPRRFEAQKAFRCSSLWLMT